MNHKSKSKHTQLKNHQKLSSPVPIIILIVIILASIAVIIAFLFSAFTDTKSSVEAKIASLTKDYYENYLYEGIVDSESISDQQVFEKTMQKYAENGFGIIRLRQVLHYSAEKSSSESDYVASYCDENKTYIKIYPEPPYKRDSYRAEYHYSCNF